MDVRAIALLTSITQALWGIWIMMLFMLVGGAYAAYYILKALKERE